MGNYYIEQTGNFSLLTSSQPLSLVQFSSELKTKQFYCLYVNFNFLTHFHQFPIIPYSAGGPKLLNVELLEHETCFDQFFYLLYFSSFLYSAHVFSDHIITYNIPSFLRNLYIRSLFTEIRGLLKRKFEHLKVLYENVRTISS